MSRRKWLNMAIALGSIAPLVAPIGFVVSPRGVDAVELDSADAVVLESAQIKISLVLAHRGHSRVRDAGRVPVGFEDIAGFVEAQYATMVQPRRQPFAAGRLLHHAQPEARLAPGEVEGRGADPPERQPISAVGGAVDVV